MRTLRKLCGGLAILLIAFQGFATNVNANGTNKKFELQLSNIKGRAMVYLTDKFENVYHEDRIKVKDELRLMLDLSDLASGNYSLIVEDELKVLSVPVIITTQGAEVKMAELTKVYFPQLTKEGDFVSIKLLSDESNDLNIKIESSAGELLYEEVINGQTGLIGQKFKFLGGAYKITLTSKGYSESRFMYF